MATGGQPVQQAPPRRIRKRALVPIIVLAVVAVLAVVLYVRGTYPAGEVRNPASSAEGTVTQLVRDADGNLVVRCAIVVDAPPKDVWAVVTDFDRQATFLPYLRAMSGEPAGEGRWHVRGVAHSGLWGEWPFESDVVLHEQPEKGEYRSSWSEENRGLLAVNRGSWQLSPAGTSGTLVVYSLQVELAGYPSFLVRNIIMDRLHLVVAAARDEVVRRRQ